MTHPWKRESFLGHKKKVWENIYGMEWQDTYTRDDLYYTTERLFG